MANSLRSLFVLVSVFCGVLFFGSALGANESDFAVLDVRYEGNFDKVRVFINNAARGEVAQGQTVSFRLPGDKDYQVTLRHGELSETRSVYLAKELRRQLVFHGPNRPQ
jgi:hypothetical protein